MSRIPSIAVSFGLIGSGVAAWAFAGRTLIANPDLNVPLNPLGINGSPYGEVFAMAMQSPIDTYFHAGMGAQHSHPDGEECESCAEHEPVKHEHTEQCSHDDHSAEIAAPVKKIPPALNVRLRDCISSMAKASEARTNPKAASDALKRHIRRQAEDKLRFAYQLDPAHYANYNSLHFFLTEPQIGTRPELTPSAAKLAEDTIQYCLKQDGDPRPTLTAAAAASNILHLMFQDRHNKIPKYNVAQMRQCLNLLDHCLVRHAMISKQWDESKNWELLSPMRITECQDRLQFIGKIRDAAEKTIQRFEQEALNQQAAN